MKKPVLVLLALLSLLSFAQSMAQTPPVAVPAPDPAATPPVPDSLARFLATLSDGQVQALNDLVPAPLFMSGCGGSYQCPSGQLCCYMCGNPPAEGDDSFCWMCVEPVKRGCPMPI